MASRDDDIRNWPSSLSIGSKFTILVPAREFAKSTVAAVTSDTTTKLSIGKEADQLREYSSARVHAALYSALGVAFLAFWRSNRGKPKSSRSPYRRISCRPRTRR